MKNNVKNGNQNFKRVQQMDTMELLEEYKAATINLHENPDNARAQKHFQDVELEVYIRIKYKGE